MCAGCTRVARSTRQGRGGSLARPYGVEAVVHPCMPEHHPLQCHCGTVPGGGERIQGASAVLEPRLGALVRPPPACDRAAAWRAARMIADQQSPSGDFFANPVTTALAALALQAADPGSAAASSQLPDGTWRFTSSDVWDTALNSTCG